MFITRLRALFNLYAHTVAVIRLNLSKKNNPLLKYGVYKNHWQVFDFFNLYKHPTKKYHPLSSLCKQWFMLVAVSTVHVVSYPTPFPYLRCSLLFLFRFDRFLLSLNIKDHFFLTLPADRNYMLFKTYKQCFSFALVTTELCIKKIKSVSNVFCG